MELIYDLRTDHRRVSAVQSATLNTKRYGIVTDHGLFGSGEWWKAVDTGALTVYLIEGLISRVYMAGHNDFPEFEVDDGKTKTQWERSGDIDAYVVGLPVIVEIVLTKNRFSYNISRTAIRIWLETTGTT